MVLNKRGIWRGYILTAILGLMVVGIGLYFIFGEYFTQDEIDWESCRQSLILRNGMPEKDLKVHVASTKNTLPIKCGTKTVTIDYKDVERAEKKIAETISSCWYMIGEGKYNMFPGSIWDLGSLDTPCIVCARIHLDKDVREFYTKEGDGLIDIKMALDEPLQGKERSFWEYLNPSGGEKAFMYFNTWTEEFSLDVYEVSSIGTPDLTVDMEIFNFSRYLYPDRGDLFITYAQPTAISIHGDKVMKPYIVLLQEEDFDKLSDKWMNYWNGLTFAKVCSSIESVPS